MQQSVIYKKAHTRSVATKVQVYYRFGEVTHVRMFASTGLWGFV
jgi:hypothetical protein